MKAFAKFALAASLCVVAEAAPAQEPVRGGILRQAVVAEPYTLDCHAATTVYVTSAMAPHYSTLVRYDPQNYPHVIGDLAQNWSVSDDGLTYTFKLHPNVKFHDGSPLTSKDVAVSLERIRKPPEGIVSARAPLFQRIKAIETPDEGTVIIRMNEREVALIELLANPLNCIYSAAKLAEDPRFPEKQVLGSGPFRFTGRVSGSSWEGVRYENFHRKGEPYLDRIQAVLHERACDPQCSAIRSGRCRIPLADAAAARSAGRQPQGRRHRAGRHDGDDDQDRVQHPAQAL